MILDERCEEGCYYELVEGVRPEFRCQGTCALYEVGLEDEDDALARVMMKQLCCDIKNGGAA